MLSGVHKLEIFEKNFVGCLCVCDVGGGSVVDLQTLGHKDAFIYIQVSVYINICLYIYMYATEASQVSIL